MAIDIRLPNINGSTEAEQLYQIKRYLYQLAEELKYNLNTLEAGTSDEASIDRVGIIDSLNNWKLAMGNELSSIATIRQKVSSHGASIISLTEWRSEAEKDISSIAQIEQVVSSQGARITLLTDWKSGVEGDVASIASIKQDASNQGAIIKVLTEWKSGVEGEISSIASIEQRVSDAENTIKLLTELNDGDASSLAELVNRVSATETGITGLTTWKNSVINSITKIDQISTQDYASITGLAQFKSDTAKNEARIEGKADGNASSIKALAEWKGGVEKDVSSIAGIKSVAEANQASLVGLAEFKTDTSASLTRIEGKADANKASIDSIAEWKSNSEKDVASIASIKAIAEATKGQVDILAEWKSSVNDNILSIAGIKSLAEANQASVIALTEWQTDAKISIAKVDQISSDDLASITGLAKWKSDLDGVSSKSLAEIKQTAENAKASIGLVVDNGAVKGSILIDAINGESSAKIAADRLDIEGKTLNIKVKATNIEGGLTIGQLPETVAKTSDIPTNISALNNDVGYQTSTNVNDIVDGKGYQTKEQVTTLTNDTIMTTNVLAQKLRVKAANIEDTLTANQIKCTDLNAFGATIGGFTIDNNSIHTRMGTSDRILLCSGTSARYKVGDFSSTGWTFLAGDNFGVLKNGTMYAANAHIQGELTTGATADGKEFGVKIGDGFIHVNSNAFYDIPTDSGQVYLLMKFDTEDGHTWGLFASGPYGEGANIELDSLFVKRIDSFRK